MFKKISIEYCGEWNYYPKAAGLAAAIEKEFGIKSQLIKSGGGVFEVVADDTLIFSKRKEFRFPTEKEIFERLRNGWRGSIGSPPGCSPEIGCSEFL